MRARPGRSFHARLCPSRGFWPRPFWGRAWLSSTARWSTSRCPRCKKISTRRFSTCSGWSNPTRFFSPHYFWPADPWATASAGGASSARGVALFALASIGCGLAQSVGQLIVARAMQGIAGALLVPGSLAIISASFDEARRGQAIGTWSGFTAITAGIGPVMGGWLIEHVSWRAVFFINVPLGAHRAVDFFVCTCLRAGMTMQIRLWIGSAPRSRPWVWACLSMA